MRAAIELLNAEGSGGVSLHQIAAKAGVNVALVKYYFGDKESLLRAVTEQIMREWRAAITQALLETDEPAEKLRARLGATAQVFRRYPNLNRLVIDTILGSGPEATLFIENFLKPNLAEHTDLLNKGRKAGAFRDLDPLFFFIVYTGITDAFATSAPLLRALLGKDVPNDKALQSFVAFAGDLILHGIAAPKQGMPAAVPNRLPAPRKRVK